MISTRTAMTPRDVGATVALGALCGVAWAAAFRAVMSEFAGYGSQVAWVDTFVAILLPGVVVGGLLGWAYVIRLSGGRRGWRWLGAAPAAFAVGADKVRVAELADRRCAVALATGPEVTAGKPAEHRRPPGARALALQGVKNFLDAVSQNVNSDDWMDAAAAARRGDILAFYGRRRAAG